MSLDLFDRNTDDAINYAARVSAPDLPATYSDTFNDAWNHGRLVGQSIAGQLRKGRALSDYMDEVRAKSGDPFQMDETATVDDMNAKVRALKARNPSLDLAELTDDELQRRADELGVRQVEDHARMERRERTWGGTFGDLLGSASVMATDPVNMIAFPLAAPEALGVLGTALAWGAIGAGSQGVIEVLNASSRERIQPGYTNSAEPISNVLEAGVGGAVLGGGLKGLSSLWSRYRTGAWPRTVRDAGNVLESEAQIASTNPLIGVEGEAVHRTALGKAIDDLVNGRPVDVDGMVSGDMLKAYDARVAPTMESMSDVIAARNAVTMERAAQEARLQPDLPFAGSIAEGQEAAAVAKLGQRLEDIAESVGSKLAPEEGRKLAERISRLPSDEAVVAMDEFFLRPNTLLETLPSPSRAVTKPRMLVSDAATTLRDELTPARIAEIRTDADVADTVSRDLDKLLIERPDLEMPVGAEVDQAGQVGAKMQRVRDVVADADARLAAAKEIKACTGPLPTAERVA